MDIVIGYIGIVGVILFLLMINRQVLGAGLYNTFGPIMMAGLLYSNILIGLSVMVLLMSSYIAREITHLVMKRIYASQILKSILYIWITILIFFAVHYAGYQQGLLSGESFSSQYIVLLLGYIVLFAWTMSKNYAYGKGDITWNRLGYNLWFFILAGIIIYLMQSDFLLGLFSGNIIALILLTGSIMAVGLYDGLQVKEMIRFRKLIWNKRTTSKYKKK